MALARVLGLAFLVLSLVSVLFILSHSSVLAQTGFDHVFDPHQRAAAEQVRVIIVFGVGKCLRIYRQIFHF